MCVSFQPVLHDWCNKGHGVCYPVCGNRGEEKVSEPCVCYRPRFTISFHPVLHDWCNKGRGMCYPICGMMHIKEPLLI